MPSRMGGYNLRVTIVFVVAVLLALTGLIPALAAEPTVMSGTVTDEVTGESVPNACIQIDSPEFGNVTYGVTADGPSGEWSYTLPAGWEVPDGSEFTVRAYSCFSAPWDYLSEFYDDKFGLQEPTPIFVATGASTSGIDIALSKKSSISGTISSPDGSVIGTADILVYDLERGIQYVAFADGPGTPAATFSLTEIPSGNYAIMLRPYDEAFGNSYEVEWHDGALKYEDAQVIGVTSGADVAVDILAEPGEGYSFFPGGPGDVLLIRTEDFADPSSAVSAVNPVVAVFESSVSGPMAANVTLAEATSYPSLDVALEVLATTANESHALTVWVDESAAPSDAPTLVPTPTLNGYELPICGTELPCFTVTEDDPVAGVHKLDLSLLEAGTVGFGFGEIGPPTGPWGPFSSADEFVLQQYRDFLGREGEAAGVAVWTDALVTEALTPEEVIDQFMGSAEFELKVAPIVRLYSATFLRLPDYDGLVNWVNASNAGMPLTVIANEFTTSEEFQIRYGSLSDTDFVELLYQNVLGRGSDPVGLANWVGRLESGQSRGSILVGFSESPEYRANMEHDVVVTMAYVGMLRRAPEPGGFDDWVGQMDAGLSRTDLMTGFFRSIEYALRFR